MPSLYETTPQTGTVSSANSTSLYSNTSDFTTGLVNSSVYSVNAGLGISVNPTTGNVVVTNTGVTSIVAGANIAISSATGAVTISATGLNTGDVVGPASATDNALARYDGTTGKLIKNSTAILNNAGDLSLTRNLTVDSGVLFVDSVNNRIGINNLSPQYELHIDQGADGFTQFGMTTAERTMILTMNDGDDLLSLNYNSADRLQFDTVNQWFYGNYTGFNTATPAYTVDVNGTGNFQGVITGGLKINGATNGYSNFIAPTTGSNLNYTLPGTGGAANTVLTNNGSGVLSWALPGGGGSTFGNITIAVVDDNTIATTTGNLILGNSADTTYYPVLNSGAAEPVTVQRFTTSTNAQVRSLALNVQSSGTPTVGFGNQIQFQIEAQPGNTERAGYVSVVSTDLTVGSEDFKMSFGLMQNGATVAEKAYIDSAGNLTLDGGITVSGSTSGSSTFNAPATGSTLTYTLPGAAGAANTVLTNNGSGTLSWALPGGGGSTFGNITIAVVDDNTISTTTGTLYINGAVTTPGGTQIHIGNDADVLQYGYSDPTNNLLYTDHFIRGQLANRIYNTSATGSTYPLRIEAEPGTAITPGVGYGVGMLAGLYDNTGTLSYGGRTTWNWTDATAGTEDCTLNFELKQAGALTNVASLNSVGDLQIDGDLTVTGTNINTGVTNSIIEIDRTSTATNTSSRALVLKSTSTGTPTVGFGTALEFVGQTDATTFKQAADIIVYSTDVTTGSEDFNMDVQLMQNGAAYATKLTIDSLGNITPTNNMFIGAIRNSTVKAAGDMWGFLSGSGTGYRGVSIDNSTNTAKAPATVIRGFTGGAVAANPTTPRVLFERARGTSASPTAIQSADFLGQFVATGANGAGTWLGDTVAAAPAAMTFFAAENWASNTNVGTTMSLSLMPTAKTLASVATPTVVYTTNPQSTTWASDAFTWTNGNTIANPNTSTKLTLDNSGQLSAKGNISTTGTLTFNNEVAVNAVSELLNTNTAAGTTVAIQTNYRPSSGSATYSLPQVGWSLGNFRFNSYNTTAGAYALGPTVQSVATENWTGSANGSRIIFTAVKQGTTYTTGQTTVISASPETTNITSDTITLESSAGTDYLVLNSTSATFSQEVVAPLITIDNQSSIDTSTITTTSTATVALNTSGRNVMNLLINIIQGTDVHCVNATVLRNGATAMLTTYAEMYNTAPLATFTADVSGGLIRLLVTPTSATSTVFSSVRTSLT